MLAIAILARYSLHLEHAWRWIYVVCAVLAQLVIMALFIVLAILAVKRFRTARVATA